MPFRSSKVGALIFGLTLGMIVMFGVLKFIVPNAEQSVRTDTVTSVSKAQTWTLRSRHFLYGMPQPVDQRYNFAPSAKDSVPGISVLVREGFVVGHCDHFKVPLWVCMSWTRENLLQSENFEDPKRHFKRDEELPEYARAATSYGENACGLRLDRGHMARNRDNVAWGEDNAEAGSLMSNIVPQSASLNERAWKALEDAHRNFVRIGPDQIWIICGPIFKDGQPDCLVANEVGVPSATYKLVCWYGLDGKLRANGFIMPQSSQQTDINRYLVKISEIERRTGLIFLPELDPATSQDLKNELPARALTD